jgi:Tfp pilus assembly protein PilW
MDHVPRLPSRGPLSNRRGTTLVELLVGLVLVGLILLGMLAILRHTQVAYSQGSAAADLQGDVRLALDQITHDLRRAGRDPRGACTFATLATATATSLQLQRDLDGLGNTPAGCIDGGANSEERITFTYDANAKTLSRQAGSGTPTVLARHVEASGPVFTYHYLPSVTGGGCVSGVLTATSAPTVVQRNCTRRVTVTVRANVMAPGGALAKALRTDVDLRSR